MMSMFEVTDVPEPKRGPGGRKRPSEVTVIQSTPRPTPVATLTSVHTHLNRAMYEVECAIEKIKRGIA